mmetsp:Transcript_18005/g.31274  ORF Transcript_18005/g.31274 Transcript_18005/m.31274 type:complete len:283 (+) Transcript_18005:156-1004(+)
MNKSKDQSFHSPLLAKDLRLLAQGNNTWKLFAFEQLQRGTTSRRAVRDELLSIVLFGRSGGITPTNNGDAPVFRCCNHGIHDRFGSRLELCKLEHASRSIPHDRLGSQHNRLEFFLALWTDIQAHPTDWNTFLVGRSTYCGIGIKLVRRHEIDRQVDLNSLLLGFLHDIWHDLGARLIKQRVSNLHVIIHLFEGVCHPTTNDHLIHLIQKIHDELDLISNFGSTQDGHKRPRWILQRLGKVLKLLLHQRTGHTLRQADANHGRMSAVSGSKRIINKHISKLG